MRGLSALPDPARRIVDAKHQELIGDAGHEEVHASDCSFRRVTKLLYTRKEVLTESKSTDV